MLDACDRRVLGRRLGGEEGVEGVFLRGIQLTEPPELGRRGFVGLGADVQGRDARSAPKVELSA